MAEITSREQAERYIFSNNMAQNRTVSTFQLYGLPLGGLLIAALGFLAGSTDKDMVAEMLAFILGALEAMAFFKNLLVRRFDIDLSRLYGND